MAETINLLILGDEGVGKSSIISTYISRHFPREVPHVMIDVPIPKEIAWGNHVVTIMDSSARPNDREDLVQKILLADTVIAVYDITRPETLESVFHEWLPLVQEVRNSSDEDSTRLRPKQIIVFGNKCDLFIDDDEIREEHLRLKSIFKEKRLSLLGIICSAKQLDKIDDAFYKAVMVCLCPLQPLYDPLESEFTPASRRAFLRIFRMFDVDDDNLLNDDEITQLQNHCFSADFFGPSDLKHLKRSISANASPGCQLLRDNCVTFDGLLSVVENALKKDDYLMPWAMLTMCNYDIDLNLELPPDITTFSTELRANQLCELSNNAVRFLLKLAHHAYEENTRPIRVDSDSIEECLTTEALRSIFTSTLSPLETHPWVDPPAYKTFWKPNIAFTAEEMPPSLQIPQSLLLCGLPYADAILSFADWINHWKLLAMTEPVLVQTLLYKLGYDCREDLGLQISTSTTYQMVAHQQQQRLERTGLWWRLYSFFYPPKPIKSVPRSAIRVCLLGDNGVGKATFVWHVSRLRPPGAEIVEVGADYRKPLDTIVVGGCSQLTAAPTVVAGALQRRRQQLSEAILNNITSVNSNSNNSGGLGGGLLPLPSHLTTPTFFMTFAAIPQEHYSYWVAEDGLANCDIAVLMFQCGNSDSLDIALQLEAGLPQEMPRVFVGTKVDLLRMPSSMSMANLSTGNILDLNNNTHSSTYSNNTSYSSNAEARSSLQRALTPLEEQYQRQWLEHERVMQRIEGHVSQTHLPQVVLTSTLAIETATGVRETLDTLREVALYPQLAIPNSIDVVDSKQSARSSSMHQKQKPPHQKQSTSKHKTPTTTSNHNSNNSSQKSSIYSNNKSSSSGSSSSSKPSLTAYLTRPVNVGLAAALGLCSMLVYYRHEMKDLVYALFAQTTEVLQWTAQQPSSSTLSTGSF